MSSAFTAAHRRKRIATYGKASRSTTNFTWNEDAPSPDRPRKQAGALQSVLRRPGATSGSDSTVGNSRANPSRSLATRDVFDVPSEDELAPLLSPVPTKIYPAKTSPKQVAPMDDFDVPSSGNEAPLPRRRIGKTPQPTHKHDAPRRLVPPLKKLTKTDRSDMPSSDDPLAAPPRQRAKTPLSLRKPDKNSQLQQQTERCPVVRPKAVSRATTPVPTASTVERKNKSASTIPAKNPAVKPTLDVDIFDVPSSDGETAQRTSRRPRPAPLPRAKTPTVSRPPGPRRSPAASIESDDSNASKKRKWRGSSQISLTANVTELAGRKEEESVVPQRSKKYRKKEDSVSPKHDSEVHTQPPKQIPTTATEPTINKPKRTRVRTVPVQARAPISKGQSSPAKLHGMLAMRSVPQRPPAPKLPELSIIEDVTMYDIHDPATPPRKALKSSIAGSVTPRQREIFGNLLGDSSENTTPGMPSIARLQLTVRKPRDTLASLARSSSDIPQTAHSRKPRLIDTLMQAQSESDEEGEEEEEGGGEAEAEEDEDSESDEDIEQDITKIPIGSRSLHKTTYRTATSSLPAADDAEMDDELPTNSQTSQGALHLNTGPKVTYAKQRSYLEESNLEDGLLLAMDFDDIPGLGGSSSNKASNNFSDEEEEPTSQVRGIHELRRRGQNEQFMLEAQTSIDEIAGKAGLGASARRSVMLEFCTQLADEKFVDQLLNSALDHQFFSSLASKGDVIFDFAAIVATAFILKTGPGFTILDKIHGSDIMATLTKLLDLGTDIGRIAKERKTNLSRVGQESVAGFRKLVQDSSIWLFEKPEKVTPQIVAMKTLDLLILNLRQAGSTEALLSENTLSKLLDITGSPCDRLKNGTGSLQDLTTLNLAFSILEAVSMSKEKQTTWSNKHLRRLVEMMPALFVAGGASPIRLAIRLCMNLTNNKPKACEAFSVPAFVQPLVRSISQRFTLLAGELEEEQRTEVLEGLILSLGAMINLAEFSDQARTSVIAEEEGLVDALAKIFLDGSERAAQADSMEESQSNVAIGYLAVLLGNLCLNDFVRYKVRSRLPGNKIDMLVDKVREFVQYNERVDNMTKGQFEGDEGRETWQNFTMRLMLVAERLEQAEA
ncbi:uncharacterized protein BDR25DRAFT_216283 [Lindgomyces ingoldianus]|uniref:Uncharacterized protein n=1 Tax=Lindgomyces ingoldianus TaxID=673940 RepID=A0ACB6R4Z7_9PLEO|nr:uncharacterized protein BDR25DRAFT_216283 [Lindgomyces ingoldianus]KAF2474363.1 hypothetical protein BDR25DRAFT_216283 [Lindgomyces ingoldianus]